MQRVGDTGLGAPRHPNSPHQPAAEGLAVVASWGYRGEEMPEGQEIDESPSANRLIAPAV